MMSLKIIIDSTAGYSPEELEQLDLTAVPLAITMDGREYQDGVDLSPQEFYQKLAYTKSTPVTGKVDSLIFEHLFSFRLEEADEVVAILLSGSLSGTCEAAREARERLVGPERIHIVDTGSVSMGSMVLINEAVRLRHLGVSGEEMARTLESGGPVNLVEAILSPIWEVVLSVGVGLLLGILFTFLLRFFKDAGSRLSLSIAFVLGAVALANEVLGVSSLLMCMALGAAFCNLSKNSADVYRQVDAFTPPLFMMFFVLSGADLQLSVLPTIGVVGVVYVVLRVVGKWLGAWMGAKIMHASPAITKYLGPALLPQAGVAIGLSFLAQQVVPQYAATIRAVVLCATLIYELIGPAVSKKTLQAAGEIAKDA